MTLTTAIQRAEQWRKEGACGEAAKVAIALLNELERVQALYTSAAHVQQTQNVEQIAHCVEWSPPTGCLCPQHRRIRRDEHGYLDKTISPVLLLVLSACMQPQRMERDLALGERRCLNGLSGRVGISATGLLQATSGFRSAIVMDLLRHQLQAR
ncbi:hypothetical protein [Herbaspirillum aquaticum]|uniref:hypothetical protein n=1 Tax=Herbaspirillum aquaticum TaxID=568783 RepID=UPI0024DEDC0A|nr:hypothetical protein [Herbaspirillum aquaticum]